LKGTADITKLYDSKIMCNLLIIKCLNVLEYLFKFYVIKENIYSFFDWFRVKNQLKLLSLYFIELFTFHLKWVLN